jgi:hypothetical protein
MGYAKKRVGEGGKPRYTAVYVDLRGSERSAGTFPSEKAANRATLDRSGHSPGGLRAIATSL